MIVPTENLTKPNVSKSAIETFARCPKLFYYQYVLRLETVWTPDELKRGLDFHEYCLEQFWAGKPPELDKVSGYQDESLPVVLKEVMKSYHDLYSLDGITVHHIEPLVTFESPYGTNKGYIDAVVEYLGEFYLVESKTTDSEIELGSWYWKRLDLEIQTGYYMWLAEKSLGIKVAGVIYDVTRVPKLTRGKDGRKHIKGETAEQFEQRVAKYVADNQQSLHQRVIHRPDVSDAMEQVHAWGQLMSYAFENNLFPRNHNGCYAFKRWCEFSPVCKREVNLVESTQYRSRDDS